MSQCQGFFRAAEEKIPSCLDTFQSEGALQWLFGNILESFYNFFYALFTPTTWGLWATQTAQGWLSGDKIKFSLEAKQSLMRFIYYGGSVEFFFVIFTGFILLTLIGLWRHNFMWGMVRHFERISNTIGRIAAWAVLLMVLQQIMIVFLQRIFTVAEISLLFGTYITFDVSWWAEGLKLYNAMLVALCVSYTFIQGGQVRVDLIYSGVSFKTKRLIDMFGSLFLMMPAAVVTWMYGWYFLWRHMIVPKTNATDTLERLLMKARALRWNVETIGFSPNGFNAYFLFKVLLVSYAALIFLQAITFFYRSYLEYREGEKSDGKYLDHDHKTASPQSA